MVACAGAPTHDDPAAAVRRTAAVASRASGIIGGLPSRAPPVPMNPASGPTPSPSPRPAARARATGCAALALALACAAPLPAAAVERPLWEVGAGGLVGSFEAWPAAAERSTVGLLYPWFVYRGEVLRVQDGSVTARLVDRRRFVFDMSFDAAPAARSRDTGARAGMPGIGWLLEAGPRLRMRLDDPADRDERWFGSLSARAAVSIDGGVTARGFVVAPSVDYLNRKLLGTRLTLNASLAAEFATADYTDHLYGVEPRYATAARPAYDARGGYLGTRLYGSAQYRWNETVTLFAFVDAGLYGGAANRASPLFERSRGGSAGVGLAFTLARSATRVTVSD